ncbi:AmmeMemoRadiSam system protein B, partial [Candidatus Woesearchaeota archaeon]|nr:AmmeMemoRadiSam system protein B [Candidatus Woesearchaeota archaeon]
MKKIKAVSVAMIVALIFLISYRTDNFRAKKVREEAVAGSWYPGTEAELSSTVQNYLNNVKKGELNGTIRAIIVPHAGYRFSGQIAAAAFSQLDDIYD